VGTDSIKLVELEGVGGRPRLVTYGMVEVDYAGNVTSNGVAVCLQNGTGCPATSAGWTDSGTNVYLTTPSDNVGIGETSPTQKLHIDGGSTSSTGKAWTDVVNKPANWWMAYGKYCSDTDGHLYCFQI
jgi:hypothetical protein